MSARPALVSEITELRARLDQARAQGLRIGFVPTMGALHAGHSSLMDQARAEDDLVVVSIFVNPLQFGVGEDLEDYPRDLARDARVCAAAGVDVMFVPTVDEMFPAPAATTVSVAGVSDRLEGSARLGHLDGVATVVVKLFGIVGRCSAYFGEKDFQQLVVIRRLVVDLSIPVRVVGGPVVREPDGLALSSRNVYLSREQRAQAPVLRRALETGVALVRSGETDPVRVEAAMASVIATAPDAEIDYAAAVDSATLSTGAALHGDVRLLVAVRFGRTRLIDNVGCRVP